jgi:cyclopropane-fatty-acyl-phospholipid synthase
MNEKITRALDSIDIKINGTRPWDIQVHNKKWYKRVLSEPSLAFGESYMDGWWDCQALDQFFYRVLRGLELSNVYHFTTIIKFIAKHIFLNEQSRLLSRKVADVHYNLGNDLYQPMLGTSMAYTCGYWSNTEELTQAQNNKYDLVCRKLQLKPGERVLELGCGWGGFAHYAATHYGVEMHSVNISTEQMSYAADLCKGLPVNLFTCDYRDMEKYNSHGTRFDKLVSIGMCEHVGHKNYPAFMRLARENIKDDGLFLMHTIGKNNSSSFTDPWVRKYIFPSGQLPSVKLISGAAEDNFVIEDLHNFSTDYDKTLMAWHHNFINSWDQLKGNYDERFYRMWNYYLLSCAGSFRARTSQLWQFIFSPQGQVGGYVSIR